MQVGIIIQGPLITFGQGPNNSLRGYDATEDVIENFRRALIEGYDPILVTWSPTSECEESLVDRIKREGIRVLVIEPPSVTDPDHRYKQRYAFAKAIEYLEQSNKHSHYARIRTDMRYPNDFWDYMKLELVSGNADVLHVSQMMNDQPFYMGDFFYLGTTDVVKKFIHAIIVWNGKFIHPSIALDDGIKFFAEIKGHRSLGVAKLLYTVCFQYGMAKSLWSEFILSNIRCLPADVWRKILWRGKMMNQVVDSSCFKFDSLPLSEKSRSKVESLRLLFDDMKRYLKKRWK